MPTIREMFRPGVGPVVKLVPFGVTLARTPRSWGRWAVVVDGLKAGEVAQDVDGTWIAYSGDLGPTPGLVRGFRRRDVARDYAAGRSSAMRSWGMGNRSVDLVVRVAGDVDRLVFVDARAARRVLAALRDLGVRLEHVDVVFASPMQTPARRASGGAR